MALVSIFTGCKRKQPTAPPPAPLEVQVVRPLQHEVTDWDVYSGQLAAPETVDVRARVSGFIDRAPFNEGAIVNQGDLLFVIDVRPYQAELNRALAQLAEAQAQRDYAVTRSERFEQLQGPAAAELERLEARRAARQAEAALAAAEAAVEAARLNVEWCQVTAPITGRVSRKLVTPGNLITGGPGQATLLTTLTSIDPVYCYVDVDERSVRRYQRMVREGGRPSARDIRLPVQLALTDETVFRHEGYIDFIDNRLDPDTGTISVRGVFPNPSRELLPGFSARLRIPGRGPYLATLIPEQAINTNLAQQYVLVADENNTVRLRPVQPGNQFGKLRAVQGVTPEDRVLITGLVQVRPNMTVRPQEVPIETAATQAQPATQAAAAMPAGQGPSRSSSGPAAEGGNPGLGIGGGAGAPGSAAGAGVGGASGAGGGAR